VIATNPRAADVNLLPSFQFDAGESFDVSCSPCGIQVLLLVNETYYTMRRKATIVPLGTV
jgi:hypothetical protein